MKTMMNGTEHKNIISYSSQTILSNYEQLSLNDGSIYITMVFARRLRKFTTTTRESEGRKEFREW